eukprot:m.864075 g.864075  ORF g.864075 m.864075 type:complete len:2274 (+) comp59707_c0_seq8:84-6905(+)
MNNNLAAVVVGLLLTAGSVAANFCAQGASITTWALMSQLQVTSCSVMSGNLAINLPIAPSATPITISNIFAVTGSISIVYTDSSYTTPFGITFMNLASVGGISVATQGNVSHIRFVHLSNVTGDVSITSIGRLAEVTLNDDPLRTLNISKTVTIQTATASGGGGELELVQMSQVTGIGALNIYAIYSNIRNVSITGSNLAIGAVYFGTHYFSSSAKVANIQVTGMKVASSLQIQTYANPIDNVLLTSDLSWKILGALTISSWTNAGGTIGSLTLDGLSRVTGNVDIRSSKGAIGIIQINGAALMLGGTFYIATNDQQGGSIDTVVVTDCAQVAGAVTFYANINPIGNVTMTGLKSIGGALLLQTISAPLSYVSMSGNGWMVSGSITVQTNVGASSRIQSVLLDGISSAQSFALNSYNAPINSVVVNGAYSGLTIFGATSFVCDYQYTSGGLPNVLFTNTKTLGPISIYAGASAIGSVAIHGLESTGAVTISTYARPISSILLNGTRWSLAGPLAATTGTNSTLAKIDTISLIDVASTTKITVTTNSGSLNNFIVNGAATAIQGTVLLQTQNDVNGAMGNLWFLNVSSISTMTVYAVSASIANLTVTGLTSMDGLTSLAYYQPISYVYLGGSNWTMAQNVSMTTYSAEIGTYGPIVFDGIGASRGLSFMTYQGPIPSVLINGVNMTVTGDIVLATRDSYTKGYIGNLTINNVTTVTGIVSVTASNARVDNIMLNGLQYINGIYMFALNAPIATLTLSSSTSSNMTINGIVYLLTYAYTPGTIGTVFLDRLARCGGFSINTYQGAISKFLVTGAALNVTGDFNITTLQGYSLGSIAEVTVTNVPYIGGQLSITAPSSSPIGAVNFTGLVKITKSLTISSWAGAAPIGPVTLSGNAWTIGGGVSLMTYAYVTSVLNSVVLSGLVACGDLSIKTYEGPLTKLSIESSGLTINGNVNIMTDNNYVRGAVGNISLTAVNVITGFVNIYGGSSSLNSITMTGLQSIGGNLTVNLLAASVGLLNMSGSAWTVGGYVTVNTGAYQQSFISSLLLTNLAATSGILVNTLQGNISSMVVTGSTLNVTNDIVVSSALYYTLGTINLAVSNLVRTRAVLVQAFGSAITSVALSGVVGGSFGIVSSCTVTASAASINSVAVSNVKSMGSLSISNPTGNIQTVSVTGTNAIPLTLGSVDVSSATTVGTFNLTLGAVSNITGSVSLIGTGQNGFNPVYINTAVGLGNAPLLTISGDVTIGSAAQATYANPGPIVFDQLLAIKGKVAITLANSKVAGNILLQGNPAYFTIGQKFLLLQSVATSTQNVSLSNLTQLVGVNETSSSGTLANFFDAYLSTSSNRYNGLLTVNARTILGIDATPLSVSTVSFPNDLMCINTCKGRGMIPVGMSMCGTCDCFGGWQGSDCATPNPCTINKTCDCACNQWSSWSVVVAGQSGTMRTRSCPLLPPSGLSCDTVGLTGTVVCVANQFESTAPTATSFRVCTYLTNCTALQYQTKAPTTTSDRQCTTMRVCSPLEYQTVAPTSTSDRSCGLLQTCNTNYQYQSQPLTGTSDRICDVLRNCTASEYQSAAPTATSNRVCAPIRTCNLSIEYQAAAPTPTSDRYCPLLTVCAFPSQYQSIAASATSDRFCLPVTAPCDSSIQYERTAPTPTNDRVCQYISVCSFYQYEKAPPTLTTDRDCRAITDCTSDSFEAAVPTTTSDRTCNKATICKSTEVIYQQPTATSDRICTPDYCASTPCFNSGICFNDRTGPTCVCTAAYTGALCETKILNPCDSSPCTHGGTCYALSGVFACVCPTGYSGATCETVSTGSGPCAAMVCKNGGVCYSKTPTTAACACATGYSGTQCETVVKNPCATTVCQHSGKCLQTTANAQGFVCQCTSDYIGTYCQDYKYICKTEPCKNNATCTSLSGGDFSCVCPAGYYAKDCSLNKCKPNPCQNNGACSTDASLTFKCACQHGFGGTLCEALVCVDGYCENGGNCSVANNERTCSCPEPFFGEFCQNKTVVLEAASASAASNVPVIGGVVGGACVLAVLLVVLALRSKRKYNRGMMLPEGGKYKFICFENEVALKDSALADMFGPSDEYETSTYDLASTEPRPTGNSSLAAAAFDPWADLTDADFGDEEEELTYDLGNVLTPVPAAVPAVVPAPVSVAPIAPAAAPASAVSPAALDSAASMEPTHDVEEYGFDELTAHESATASEPNGSIACVPFLSSWLCLLFERLLLISCCTCACFLDSCLRTGRRVFFLSSFRSFDLPALFIAKLALYYLCARE